MKATLCVFVALVAVTSAAPALRRGACTNLRFCTTTCSCGTTAGDTCNAATKYCTGGAVSTPAVCSNTAGTTAVTGACKCGTSTVTAPAAQFVDAAQGKFCLYSKAAVGGTANTQASIASCAKVAAPNLATLNGPTTCGDVGALNGCGTHAGTKRCKTADGTCLPVCTASTAGGAGAVSPTG